ncbi:hypothetical protein BBO99_00003789 [Phytophthora kernoviae]|uniref:NADH dehydrogenase [ubiquinone] 1 alpha subcomplex subunit 5 n=2 Tax=Phytophthora kernoviae TaxID=325452 RepID=A0A3F2RU32_9STRA|nr:hypothetical protein G195_004370 [Phytophthora kernoviae 00238/432]KAG2527516.1 hypothetical protein JM16_003450 [Phytophthora kernoviae]KAG2528761.1 hypothetical protein JM18_003023 [Phytophthora kernoviae]RLN45075.1 hypothetical protein BBI17_003811 [Phytophthora kernoviae]RLN46890.1 hypothetical protein BBJ29_002901 [Phytophthora kernoviae]
MWASRVLRMAVTKTSTGLVGLPVNPNARQDLIQLYRRTLQEILPPEAKNYRNAVEKITNFRLNVVETHEDVSEAGDDGTILVEDTIERTINCGQLEELIEQAEDELSVIPVYLEHKLWESPVESAK